MLDEPYRAQVREHVMDLAACRALWCAVIQEQFALAMRPVPTQMDRAYEIDGARRWFGSRDYHIACSLAGVDAAKLLTGVERRFAESGVISNG